MSIEIRNISFVYLPGTPFEHKALKNVSLSFDDGEFVGLIGHTGSGKSTLAQHLNGLLKPSEGSISVNGINITAKRTNTVDLCRRVGLVFQYPEYQLFGQTVFEDIAFGPRNLGFEEGKVTKMVRKSLELVGLDFLEFSHRSPFLLSGGQKRRIAIAGILAMQPDTLVLDEPTAGLDPAGRKDIIQMVKKLHQVQGKTIIWISHNMDEVARLVHRIVVMHNGTVYMDGSPHEIFSREQELKEIGLGIPASASVVRRLKALGKPVPGKAITVEEAFNELEQWLGGRRK